MNCYEIIINFYIPIISALIGGLSTFLGVWLTIKHESKKYRDNIIQSVKPWIFSYDDTINASNHTSINLSKNGKNGDVNKKNSVLLKIKNTDNGIALVDKVVSSKKNEYLPYFGCVIGKNELVYIYIEIEDNDDDLMLYINDVHNNTYTYKILYKNGKHIISETKYNNK